MLRGSRPASITSALKQTGRSRAVGYLRVSTKKQGKDGVGLEAQRSALQDYVRENGFVLSAVFEDVESGRGPKVLETNKGLLDALKAARHHKCSLLVHDLGRVARSVEVLTAISRSGVSIISVGDGVLLDPGTLAARAAYHQAVGERISRETRKALQELKRSGRKLGNRTNLAEAQRRGALQNKIKADERVERIAEVIQKAGDPELMTAAQVVDLLNSKGILTGRGAVWTVPAVQRPLRAARKLLAEERDVQQEEEQEDMKAHELWGRF